MEIFCSTLRDMTSSHFQALGEAWNTLHDFLYKPVNKPNMRLADQKHAMISNGWRDH